MEDWIAVFTMLLLFGLGFIPVTLLFRSLCDGRGRTVEISRKNRAGGKKKTPDDPLTEFENSGVMFFDLHSRKEE